MEKDQILKMTVPKLREEALKIENVSGVHGMNKTQLISLLFEVNGIPEDKKVKAVDPDAKKKIREFREKKLEFNHAGDKKQAKILQRKIHRMRRSTRV